MSHKRFKMFQQRAERDSHCMFYGQLARWFCVEKSGERRPAKRLLCICARKKPVGQEILYEYNTVCVCVCARGRELLLVRASSFRLTRAQSSLANLPISWASIRWLIFSSLQMSLGDNGCAAQNALRTTIAVLDVCVKIARRLADPSDEPPPFEWETATSGIYWCAARGDQGGWKKKTQQRTCSAL